ncbi:hypothetical protein [Bosea sp. (in: a-proteobacteria)]|jgi:hypothetical protein|uniref:hypothetical protein n=1 Tax=Bosea sp. (in: a-proteobacteria) TaxID=1871050 RepID=UPI003567B7AE
MQYFEDEQDVEEWLEPLDYAQFWRETATFCLDLPSRDHCDTSIARRKVPEATVLSVLKGMARLQIVERQKLPARITVPWMSRH